MLEDPSTNRSRGFPASASEDQPRKLRRINIEGQCYHVSSVTLARRPIFAEPACATILSDAIQFVRSKRAFVLAQAVMPDHFHALIVPKAPYEISQIMQTIKGYSSREINRIEATKGSIWQAGFYDRVIRDDKQLEMTIAYIEANPVKAGLVTRAGDYPWSSAHGSIATDLAAWLAE